MPPDTNTASAEDAMAAEPELKGLYRGDDAAALIAERLVEAKLLHAGGHPTMHFQCVIQVRVGAS